MKQQYTTPILLLFALMMTIATSCDYFSMPEEPSYTNPFDTLNQDFIWPEISISSPTEENPTLSTDAITFELITTYEDSQISYLLVGATDAGGISPSQTIDFSFLNEGDYELLLKEVTSFGITQKTATSYNFTVNAVTGPALVLADKKVAHGAIIQLTLLAEEVSNLKAAQVKITYDTDVLSFDSAYEGDFLANEADGQFFDATTSGDTLIISAARLGNGGVSGTGIIGTFSFTSVSEVETSIAISSNSLLRDGENNTISIGYWGETIVTNN